MLKSDFNEEDLLDTTHLEIQENYAKEIKISTKNSMVFSEIGIYQERFRFDILSLWRNNRTVYGWEVKNSRADFKQDKKWGQYIEYVNYFSFIRGLGDKREIIELSELPNEVGLIDYVQLREFGKKSIGKYVYEEDREYIEKNKLDKWGINYFNRINFWKEKYPFLEDFQLINSFSGDVFVNKVKKGSKIQDIDDRMYIKVLESIVYRDSIS